MPRQKLCLEVAFLGTRFQGAASRGRRHPACSSFPAARVAGAEGGRSGPPGGRRAAATRGTADRRPHGRVGSGGCGERRAAPRSTPSADGVCCRWCGRYWRTAFRRSRSRHRAASPCRERTGGCTRGSSSWRSTWCRIVSGRGWRGCGSCSIRGFRSMWKCGGCSGRRISGSRWAARARCRARRTCTVGAGAVRGGAGGGLMHRRSAGGTGAGCTQPGLGSRGPGWRGDSAEPPGPRGDAHGGGGAGGDA